MLGSTYAPQRWQDIEASKVKPNVFGITSTIPFGTTTSVDTVVSDDSLIREISAFAVNQTFGDTITIQVVDKNGVYFPENTVVSTPVSNWNIVSSQQTQYEAIAPFKLLGGLYIRITYTSLGMSDVNLGFNFIFLTVLV